MGTEGRDGEREEGLGRGYGVMRLDQAFIAYGMMDSHHGAKARMIYGAMGIRLIVIFPYTKFVMVGYTREV